MGQGQVSGGVSVLSWLAASVAMFYGNLQNLVKRSKSVIKSSSVISSLDNPQTFSKTSQIEFQYIIWLLYIIIYATAYLYNASCFYLLLNITSPGIFLWYLMCLKYEIRILNLMKANCTYGRRTWRLSMWHHYNLSWFYVMVLERFWFNSILMKYWRIINFDQRSHCSLPVPLQTRELCNIYYIWLYIEFSFLYLQKGITYVRLEGKIFVLNLNMKDMYK